MAEESLEEMDARIRSRSMASQPAQIQVLDDILVHINQGISLLSGHKHDRGPNFLSLLLICRAFNSLYRAREDAVLGYPVQSLTLCRSALEDWATLRWIELHPDTVDKWLWAILPGVKRPTGQRPNFDAISKKLGKHGDIASKYYDILSKFAHPMSIGLRSLVHFDPENTYLHAGSNFDEQYLKDCLRLLIEVGQVFFERVAQLQYRMLVSVAQQWVEKGKELTDRAKTLLSHADGAPSSTSRARMSQTNS